MRAASRYARIAALALVVADGVDCNSRSDSTSLVVQVDSDLIVGREIDMVAVNGHSITLASAADLPAILAFTPAGASDESITVTATARWQGTDVVIQSVTTSFQPGKAMFLVMRLDRSCVGVTCDANQTCTSGACGPKARTPVPYPGTKDASATDVPADAPANSDGPAPEVSDARDDRPADREPATDATSDVKDAYPEDLGPRCGDRQVNQASERCDDGAESATCNADCTFAVCGDGKVNRTANEQCDVSGGADTPSCNGTTAGSVNAACHFTFCGDGYVNQAAGETCDTPGGADTQSCNGAAAPPGVACHVPVCGDGYIDSAAGETCDTFGGVDTAACNGKNAPAGLACHASICGDGYVNLAAGETCDNLGGADTTSCNGVAAGLGVGCTLVKCGDGYINALAGETCEVQPDGNDTVNCNGGGAGAVRCRKVACGDSYINRMAGETCDVLGGADTATCNGMAASAVGLQCQYASCGDGYINGAAGEACDVVGGGDSAGCNGTAAGTALQCKKPSCGDGYLNTNANEACDDKNTASGDGCSSPACQVETGFVCFTPGQACRSLCGDGLKVGSEACDDFNTDACGTCNVTCSTIQAATPAIGTITAVSAANLNSGETFTLSDGLHVTVVFEFNDNVPSDSTHFQITRSISSSTQMATKIANAINSVGAALAINAQINNANKSQVLLTNGTPGSAGNVKLTKTVANTSFLVTGMAGGAGFDCPATIGCGGNNDCQSGVCCLGTAGTSGCPCPAGVTCAPNRCLAPTCTDGVLNGNETDLDCGGGICPKCSAGQTCIFASDCASGVCTQSICAASS
jgi:cysteine-rich repeat protein